MPGQHSSGGPRSMIVSNGTEPALISLFSHDFSGKPVSTFPDRALEAIPGGSGSAGRRCHPRPVPAQKFQVAPIGFELQVEDIADHGNNPEDGVEQHVPGHAQQNPIRCAHTLRPPDDVAGHHSPDRVADAGHETNQTVEPEANIGARNVETIVHQSGDEFQIRIVVARMRKLAASHSFSLGHLVPSRRPGDPCPTVEHVAISPVPPREPAEDFRG